MPTLESLRRQIDTATDLKSVVSTMKTLAAVSIHQYDQAADALADYNRSIELGFHVVLRGGMRLLEHREKTHRIAAIVFGSDQGMCGQFNERITEFAIEHHQQENDVPPTGILVVGARAEELLKDSGWHSDDTYQVPTSVSKITDLVQEIVPRIEQLRIENSVTTFQIYSNRRSLIGSFKPHQRQLLPISPHLISRWRDEPWESRSLPTFAADRQQLISQLVREYLLVSLYRACAESLASENASRISAMQAAEKNVDERLDQLQSEFNGLRQSAITEELLDIVSGFEALTQRRE